MARRPQVDLRSGHSRTEPAPIDNVLKEPCSSEVIVVYPDPQLTKILNDMKEVGKFGLSKFPNIEDLVRRGFPDVPSCVILPASIPREGSAMHSLGMIKELGWKLPVLILLTDWTLRTVGELYRAGAYDVIEAQVRRADLELSINRALEAAKISHESVIAAQKARDCVRTLKKTEESIVRLVIAGLQNKEIASRLNLALVTVKVYRGNAMKRLGAGNPAELVKTAVLGGMEVGTESREGL